MIYNWHYLFGACTNCTGYGYPYTDFHRLNLDYILCELKKLIEEVLDHDKRITKAEQDILKNAADILQNKTDIHNLDIRLTKAEADILANAADIVNLTARVADIEANYVHKSGDTMTGILNAPAVCNLTAPQNDHCAANKKYVDDKIANLGNLLTYKGTKATIADLPATGNAVGDVWYVESEKSAYAWVVDTANPQGHWEEFGPPVPPLYVLPKATDTTLGGVKAAVKTAADTTPVHIDSTGHLFTAGGSGGDYVPMSRLADPTAPPEHPIQPTQVAVYSTTNQTYDPNDVQATLLVADPHSDMEAVNKRTVDKYLPKSDINDSFERVTSYKKDTDTTNYHILSKTFTDVQENRIPIFDTGGAIHANMLVIQTKGGMGFMNNSLLITAGTATDTVSSIHCSADLNNRFVEIQIKLSSGVAYYTFSEDGLNMNSKKIQQIADPIDNQDAATKKYVDANFIGHIINRPNPLTTGDYKLSYDETTQHFTLNKIS